jgi:fructokinase
VTASPFALYGGIETGGTWCSCILGTGRGEIVAETRFATAHGEQTLERICEFFELRERPQAIGVAAFGPINLDTRSPDWGVVGATPKPGWSGTTIGPELTRRIGVPVLLETDVNAAAVGECRWGAGRGLRDVCYVTVGTGIGAGFVVNGRPLHGLMHPEAGHMRLSHDRYRDPFAGCCPAHCDCWEGLASGQALAARWGVPASDLDDDHPAWELEVDYLANGLVNIIFMAFPERIIVGGGVAQRSGLLDRVRHRTFELLGGYLRSADLTNGLHSYLVELGLHGRSGVLGAIALASEASAPNGDRSIDKPRSGHAAREA